MNHLNKLQHVRHIPYRKLMLFCMALMSTFTLTACQAKNPEMVTGLSVEVLNYSQEPIHFVKMHGEKISGYVDAAKIGGVSGGGTSCCSGKISAVKKTADVTIETNHGTYTAKAEVELPFPDSMDVMMVHVLPGRKVVIEVVPGPEFPRQDLMDNQIKALGLKKEHEYTGPLRTYPKYTGY